MKFEVGSTLEASDFTLETPGQIGFVSHARFSRFTLETSNFTLLDNWLCLYNRLSPTDYRLPPLGDLDVSTMILFHHKKTLLDARLLTPKPKIPQKFLSAGPKMLVNNESHELHQFGGPVLALIGKRLSVVGS